jgi:hypothetical protein
MRRLVLEGLGGNPQPVRTYETPYAHGKGRSLEIEELQAAIDKRRSLALDEESLPKLADQLDYSDNGVEDVFPEVPLQHPT